MLDFTLPEHCLTYYFQPTYRTEGSFHGLNDPSKRGHAAGPPPRTPPAPPHPTAHRSQPQRPFSPLRNHHSPAGGRAAASGQGRCCWAVLGWKVLEVLEAPHRTVLGRKVLEVPEAPHRMVLGRKVLEALWAPAHRCRYLAPRSTCPRQAAAHAQTQTPPHRFLFTHHFLHQKQAQALPMSQPPPHTCHSPREVLRGAEPGRGSMAVATALLGAW